MIKISYDPKSGHFNMSNDAGGECGAAELILNCLGIMFGVTRVISEYCGTPAAEAFLQMVRNHDDAGAFSVVMMGGGGGDGARNPQPVQDGAD